MPHSLQHNWPAPGTILSSPCGIGIRHMGIVSDAFSQGKPMVISASKRKGYVVEEKWDDAFEESNNWRVEKMYCRFPKAIVLTRARSKMHAPYSLWVANCEHFVNYCAGLAVESKQLQVGSVLVGAIFILVYGKRLGVL
jgi:hypothetical protein